MGPVSAEAGRGTKVGSELTDAGGLGPFPRTGCFRQAPRSCLAPGGRQVGRWEARLARGHKTTGGFVQESVTTTIALEKPTSQPRLNYAQAAPTTLQAMLALAGVVKTAISKSRSCFSWTSGPRRSTGVPSASTCISATRRRRVKRRTASTCSPRGAKSTFTLRGSPRGEGPLLDYFAGRVRNPPLTATSWGKQQPDGRTRTTTDL